jgi:molecular chaperone DnaK (HSP70)
VKPSYGLTDEQIEQMLEESFDHAEDDVQQRQLREARVDADTILHATRLSLEKHAQSLEPGEAERIESALTTLAVARDGDDHLRIRECYDELSQVTEPFARRIMDLALREAVEGRSLQEL